MRASQLILAGMLATAGLALGGCETVTIAERDQTAAQAADACVADIEGGKKAPQIMTYNTTSKVETHVQTFPDGAAMTVQDRQANKATGVDIKVGDRPYSCNADGRDHHDRSSKRSFGWGNRDDDYKSGKGKSDRDGAQ